MPWVVIATWNFSLHGIETASDILMNSGNSLDVVEQVARMVEDDPDVETVGFGGFPNINGEVELDAAFMDGRDLSIGAVAGLKGFRHPVSVARKVMTDTPHNFIVGQGAEDFAESQGFSRGIMVTDKIRKAWEERRAELVKGRPVERGHDTVGIVALDTGSDMAAATSTSGMAMKLRGRVGDSPLVGSGFYVDNEAGGAAATGLGEDIMKCCTSFHAVELMRQGYTPQKAAEEAVRRTHSRLSKNMEKVGCIAVVCADNKGNFGAAANHPGFTFAAASDKIPAAIYKIEPIDGIW